MNAGICAVDIYNSIIGKSRCRLSNFCFNILCMCRLFAYKTKKPKETTQLLIQSLKEFSLLANNGCVPHGIEPGHNDGWGLILYKGGDVCLHYKSLSSIKDDLNFNKILKIIQDIEPEIVVSHLRKKTAGMDVYKNIQPFLGGDVSLSHNGTVFYGNEKKDKSISDTHYFFNQFIESKDVYLNLSEKIKTIQENIEKKYDYTAMNMIFSDGKSIFAVNNSNKNYKNFDKLCLGEYYKMHKMSDKDFVLICSEKIKSFAHHKIDVLKDKIVYKY